MVLAPGIVAAVPYVWIKFEALIAKPSPAYSLGWHLVSEGDKASASGHLLAAINYYGQAIQNFRSIRHELSYRSSESWPPVDFRFGTELRLQKARQDSAALKEVGLALAQAHAARGIVYLKSCNYKAAFVDLSWAIGYDSTNPHYFALRARVRHYLGEDPASDRETARRLQGDLLPLLPLN